MENADLLFDQWFEGVPQCCAVGALELNAPEKQSKA